MRRRVSARLVLSAILLASVYLGILATPAFAKSKAKWSPTSITVTTPPGRSTSKSMTFKATAKLKSIKFSATGNGRSYISFSPSSIKSLKKGKKATVRVTIAVPAGATGSSYSATIFAKAKSKSVASKLPVKITMTKVPVFRSGTTQTLASLTIGSAGGTIAAPPGGTPISGVSVQFPAGALPGSTGISIGFNNGGLVPNAGEYPGGVMVLDAGTLHDFGDAATVTVPWPDTSKFPCPYYIDESGLLHPAQLVSLDAAHHTFSFQTFHASWYTWIWQRIADITGMGTQGTGYAPPADGMKIVNYGSEYNRGGECFGMTSFSLWYYESHKGDGDFYPRFMSVLGHQSNGTPITGQNVIATRSFISISQQWNTYYSNLAWVQQGALSQEARYAAIVNAIKNTNNPVLIYLAHANRAAGAHSVLAYAFNTISNTLSIYDPNHPGQVNSIYYNSSTKTFSPYSVYDFITYSGDGSLHLQESYQHIYDDALTDFHGSDKAQIILSSPATSGSHVTDRNITISGTIHSGSVLVTKLKIFVGSTAYEVNVGTSGTFSQAVSLESGLNHLKFQTRGKSASGTLIDLPNNLDTTDYTVNCDIGLSKILVTLTWDTDNTDVDLYVTDPTNDTSWYQHHTTADGGTLDHDDTDGYGPEHFTLLASNTIRYNSPYKVRVHYYSDHADGTIPTGYTVSIKVYEGTSREQTYWYHGYLGFDNSSNYAPGSAGADWQDVANVTLTQ